MGDLKNKRIWELDFFRGIALILMIYFHVIYDLRELYNYNISYGTGINYYIGKISAILFILIAGVSSSLSRNNPKRGLKVLGVAMVLSVVTHLYGSNVAIYFGILHFLGICMLLYPLIGRMNKYLLILLGTVIIIAGNIITGINAPNNYFFILGLTNSKFFSADYYPLMPWIGVFLYGAAAGKILYPVKKSLFNFTLQDNIISNMGRHTLIYYIIHQPVILAVMALYNFIK